MTKYFQAITPDGTVIQRSSQTRDYKYAMVFFNKTSKAWGATFASRRDLAENELARYAGCDWLEQCTVVPVKVVTSKAARAVAKSRVTDADKRATKVAKDLRKVGIAASKFGNTVRVYVPQIHAGNNAPRGWWNDYFSETNKIHRRSNRIARLIVRRAAERAGYQLDKNCWHVVL